MPIGRRIPNTLSLGRMTGREKRRHAVVSSDIARYIPSVAQGEQITGRGTAHQGSACTASLWLAVLSFVTPRQNTPFFSSSVLHFSRRLLRCWGPYSHVWCGSRPTRETHTQSPYRETRTHTTPGPKNRDSSLVGCRSGGAIPFRCFLQRG